MTPKSLFNIVLKILGLLLLKDSLPVIIQSLFTLDQDYGLLLTITSLLVLGIYLAAIYLFIFRTNSIIEKLKLASALPEEIPFNIHHSTILYIAVIILGGYIVATEIPSLCRSIYNYYAEREMTRRMSDTQGGYFVFSASKILVGLLLLGNARFIVNYVEHRRRK